MGILIDSNVFIDYERGSIDIAGHISGREQEDFFISVITASELMHGILRAKSKGIRIKRLAFVNKILDSFPVLSVDLQVAKIHAQLWADLESSGKMIGLHDSWIAATCLAHDLTLVTANLKEFSRIKGITTESWLKKG